MKKLFITMTLLMGIGFSYGAELSTLKMENAVRRATFTPPIAYVGYASTSSPYTTEFDMGLAANASGYEGYDIRITYYTAFPGGGPTATTSIIEFGFSNGQNYKGAFVSTYPNYCVGIASYQIVDSW